MRHYATDSFSKDAASRFLGFSPPTIQRWTEAKLIVAARNKGTGLWTYRRNELERFAAKVGISLDDAQCNPPHYSVSRLAKTSKTHPSRVRRFIDRGELRVIRVEVPGSKNEIVFIGHAAAGRFIADQAKAQKAG